jgi:murein DD-endopeptidase MepM/ murein hydrolase activator NlpD
MAYTVKPNDSFWRIAEQQLGSGARWREIAAANNLSEGATIHPGQVLKIPGQAVSAPPAPVAAPPRPPSAQPPAFTQTPPAAPDPELQRLRDEMEAMREEQRAAEAARLADREANRQSARVIVQDMLDSYGLGSLTGTVMNVITSADQVTEQRVMATIRQTNEYKQRFQGMALRQQAGLNAISEFQYLQLENSYQNTMRAAGLPKGFYDSPSDFAQLIGGNVSAEDFSLRVNEGYLRVRDSDPSVLSAMRNMYGVTDGELAAYFLDPEKAETLILQQVATARVGAAAARQGFENVIERTAAERMVALGVTEEQASQVFGTLAAGRELLTPLDAGETALDVADTALGLAGQSPEALQRLRTQQRRRTARFEGGGQLATTAAGVTGLREA